MSSYIDIVGSLRIKRDRLREIEYVEVKSLIQNIENMFTFSTDFHIVCYFTDGTNVDVYVRRRSRSRRQISQEILEHLSSVYPSYFHLIGRVIVSDIGVAAITAYTKYSITIGSRYVHIGHIMPYDEIADKITRVQSTLAN